MNRIVFPLVLALSLLAPLPGRADTLLIDRVHAAQGVALPARGSSMAAVHARFGAPAMKFAPVGGGSRRTPPITRWQYDAFSVYFENQHVVNAVLTKASPLELGPAPAMR